MLLLAMVVAGTAGAATTTALIWLAGNAGGVAVSLAVQGLLDYPALAFALLAVCVLAATPFLRGGWLDAAPDLGAERAEAIQAAVPDVATD